MSPPRHVVGALKVPVAALFAAADQASLLMSSWDGAPVFHITDAKQAREAARTIEAREHAIYKAQTGLPLSAHEAARDLVLAAARVTSQDATGAEVAIRVDKISLGLPDVYESLIRHAVGKAAARERRLLGLA